MFRAARKSSILCHTKLSRNHMTPELELALVTPDCAAYRQKPEKFPFQEPYWAFYWPGGQVLTRYILGKVEFHVCAKNKNSFSNIFQ